MIETLIAAQAWSCVLTHRDSGESKTVVLLIDAGSMHYVRPGQSPERLKLVSERCGIIIGNRALADGRTETLAFDVTYEEVEAYSSSQEYFKGSCKRLEAGS